MSDDSIKVEKLISEQIASVQNLHALLEPLLSCNSLEEFCNRQRAEESSNKMNVDGDASGSDDWDWSNPMVRSKLIVTLGYVLNSLTFSALKLNGVAVVEHPVMKEIERMKMYMSKLASLEEKEKSYQKDSATKLNAKGAARVIKGALWEASPSQSQTSTAASSPSSEQKKPASPGTNDASTSGASEKKRKKKNRQRSKKSSSDQSKPEDNDNE